MTMGITDWLILASLAASLAVVVLKHKIPVETKPVITNYDTGIDIARDLYREACEFAKVTFDLRHGIEKGYDLQEDYRLYDYHELLFLDKCGQFYLWCQNRGITPVDYSDAKENVDEALHPLADARKRDIC